MNSYQTRWYGFNCISKSNKYNIFNKTRKKKKESLQDISLKAFLRIYYVERKRLSLLGCDGFSDRFLFDWLVIYRTIFW